VLPLEDDPSVATDSRSFAAPPVGMSRLDDAVEMPFRLLDVFCFEVEEVMPVELELDKPRRCPARCGVEGVANLIKASRSITAYFAFFSAIRWA
jgi:hypothetical protein